MEQKCSNLCGYNATLEDAVKALQCHKNILFAVKYSLGHPFLC